MKKRFLTAALVALVAVIGLMLSSPVGARPLDMNSPSSGSVNNPKADIQQGNAACGADLPALPVIGHTNYHRRGNVVSINFHLKRAEPNTRYDISLWGDVCTFFATIGSVTTNSNGVANLSGSVTVPATSTRFFATGLSFTSFTFNDTPAVTLLP